MKCPDYKQCPYFKHKGTQICTAPGCNSVHTLGGGGLYLRLQRQLQQSVNNYKHTHTHTHTTNHVTAQCTQQALRHFLVSSWDQELKPASHLRGSVTTYIIVDPPRPHQRLPAASNRLLMRTKVIALGRLILVTRGLSAPFQQNTSPYTLLDPFQIPPREQGCH